MSIRTIGYFGSCLSALPIAVLASKYNLKEIFRIHHNRSDAFCTYYIDRSQPMLNRILLDKLLVESDNKKISNHAAEFLDNQMLPTIGFGSTLKGSREGNTTIFDIIRSEPVDVILFDNFMDISSKLMTPRGLPGFENSPLFFNPHLYKNKEELAKQFQFVDFLTPNESALNWKRIYTWFRNFQPEAKIIFLPFPYVTSQQFSERYCRARNFYGEFKHLMKGEDIDILPPLDVPYELTNGKEDQNHVKQQLYDALAGYIYLRAVAKFPIMGQEYVLGEDFKDPSLTQVA